ncbi:long-chain-fatty-acid--ligase [Ceraceosorus bombacis]|uniref:Long-chain-fatty-acid--ligase n=2 Tax=Ceraceosorus TaxID=401624 RepID=A0A0P1BLZ8_9BASI|nr:acetyl-CoA synthetase-like protein [Ceraceosorus guamensis]PWN40906.1 acetyl-CoA synthetase-like protein [Ceraceosorus guamensis]CEH16913.1 long-chain-fatty-acid--ligase [Ceraceosorus bombacis]
MAPVPGSVEIGGAPPAGETKVRRAFCSPDKLVERPTGNDGKINTMSDILQFIVGKYTNKPCMGYRELIKIHNEEKEVTKKVDGKEVKEKKTWQLQELSDYKYITYTEFNERVQNAASGLAHLGLSTSTRFNIYGSTSLDWQNLAHSCFAQNIPFCTAYDTLGPEGLQHSLAEPDVVGIFTNPHLVKTLISVLDETPTVKYVVYNGELEESLLSQLREKLQSREGSRVLSLDELKAEGKANPAKPNPPKAEDVACIMYTSGSTGKPKGVILTHGNLVAACGSVELLLGPHLRPTDTFLAYLPLAHILEFIVECSLMYVGLTMGYGGVKTLTPAGTKNCLGDIACFKPSVLVGVPTVWETIRKGINTKVNAGPTVAKYAFRGAMTWKKNKIPLLSSASEIVFNKVRAQTGGRLRVALSGGAAISKETQEFLDLALMQLLQGYGMTESCGMCTIGTPVYNAYRTVGVPSPAIEIKLVDVPDAGYHATNSPPQGEVWIRGPAVTKGYFKRDEVTKETITEDGWLKTGDVGQWNEDGTLSIIDRKKNLVKLSGGEYVALEKLESVYKSCDVVQNICVHADSNNSKPMAIVFPREDGLKQFTSKSLEEAAEDEDVANQVLKSLNEVGKKGGLRGQEILDVVVLVPEDLPMTAAQKLERGKAVKKYEDKVKKVYS